MWSRQEQSQDTHPVDMGGTVTDPVARCDGGPVSVEKVLSSVHD